MEFTPHIAGKHQSVTYDMVKVDRIPITKPKRQIVKAVKLEEGETADPANLFIEIRIEQEGYDMEYTIDLKEWKENHFKKNGNMKVL